MATHVFDRHDRTKCLCRLNHLTIPSKFYHHGQIYQYILPWGFSVPMAYGEDVPAKQDAIDISTWVISLECFVYGIGDNRYKAWTLRTDLDQKNLLEFIEYKGNWDDRQRSRT